MNMNNENEKKTLIDTQNKRDERRNKENLPKNENEGREKRKQKSLILYL